MSGSDSGGPLFLAPVRATAGVLAVLAVAGVLVGTAAATGMLGVPEVVAVDNEFTDVNASTTTVTSNLTVRNPNPIGISIEAVDISHTLFMNGIRMGSGEREQLRLPQGNSTVEVVTGVRNDRIPEWWVSHVRRGERTNVTVDARVSQRTLDRSLSRTVATRSIETDIVSAFETNRTRPINASVPYVSNPILYVNRTDARWSNVSENRTVVTANLTVTNPKSFAVPLDNVTYNVSMNGVQTGSGSTRNLTAIPADSTRNVTARLVIDNSKLDEWWVTHVRNDQRTRVRFDYAVRVDLSRFGRGTRTYSPPPINRTFETDVFGNGGGSGGFSVA